MKAILKKMQCELKAPKNQRNTFGGYNYRSLEDVAEAIKPLEDKYNVAVTLSDEIVEVGGRIYVKATATLHHCESGESISVSAYARESETKKGMDDAQITGSASSYARKYALNGLFMIDDTKDPDATNTHGKEAPAPRPDDIANKIVNAKTRSELSKIMGGLSAENAQKYRTDANKKYYELPE
jgi:hypothetical protein